jgi:choline transport protein
MAEEIPQPGKNVPIAMLASMVVGWVSVLFFSLALLFGCTDFASIPTALVPYQEAVRQGLRSSDGATFFTVWILLLYFGSMQAVIATCGRLVWAFARDNGLPYSRIFSRVHPTLKIPLEATGLVMVMCIAVGAIYVGSATAFNTFIASSVIFVHIACSIPQAFVLLGGRKRLPKRYLNLGPILGPFCNLFTILWTTFYVIMFCLPLYLPVEVDTMNYVAVVIVGFAIIIMAMLLLGKRKTFKGPVIAVEVLNAVNLQENMPHEKSSKSSA